MVVIVHVYHTRGHVSALGVRGLHMTPHSQPRLAYQRPSHLQTRSQSESPHCLRTILSIPHISCVRLALRGRTGRRSLTRT